MLNKKNKGFTLIELLAVIALLAIVGITSYSIIRKSMLKAKLKAIQTTATTLEKQAKDRITLKDEYLCYRDVDSTFAGGSTHVCNTSIVNCNDNKEYAGCKRYYGNKKCSSLYNLTDDYRMAVYYQPYSEKIFMYFGIMWDGKLKEYSEVKSRPNYEKFIERYNAKPIAKLPSTKLDDEKNNIYDEYITWDGTKLAWKEISEYKGVQQNETDIKEELNAKASNGKVKVETACSILYKDVMGW